MRIFNFHSPPLHGLRPVIAVLLTAQALAACAPTESLICQDTEASTCWHYAEDVPYARMDKDCHGMVGESLEGDEVSCGTDDVVGRCDIPGDPDRVQFYYATGEVQHDAVSAEEACDSWDGAFTPQ